MSSIFVWVLFLPIFILNFFEAVRRPPTYLPADIPAEVYKPFRLTSRLAEDIHPWTKKCRLSRNHPGWKFRLQKRYFGPERSRYVIPAEPEGSRFVQPADIPAGGECGTWGYIKNKLGERVSYSYVGKKKSCRYDGDRELVRFWWETKSDRCYEIDSYDP